MQTLNSERTWRAFAEQARKGLVDREKSEAIRVARREAEAEALAAE